MEQFEHIRHAIEEHLNSINENTAEIQALFDYLRDLEIKVDKLSSRLDQTQLNSEVEIKETFVEPLTKMEKEVFLVLYTEDSPLSYEEISMKARIPLSTVTESVSSLLSKGMPLLRSTINDRAFFKLSPSFKERQAKENVINLSLESFMK